MSESDMCACSCIIMQTITYKYTLASNESPPLSAWELLSQELLLHAAPEGDVACTQSSYATAFKLHFRTRVRRNDLC